jgi:predicted YcjX-like family ATPase
MNKYEIIYQEVSEARVTIEAKDESDLADLMEHGNFDLDWKIVDFYSEWDLLEIDDE